MKHDLDTKYESLNTDFREVDRASEEFKLMEVAITLALPGVRPKVIVSFENMSIYDVAVPHHYHSYYYPSDLTLTLTLALSFKQDCKLGPDPRAGVCGEHTWPYP